MDKPDIEGLIKAVEEARSYAFALDRLIARSFGWFRYTRELGCTMKRGGWISPDDFMGTYSDGSPILDSLHGTDICREPPHFTGNLAATKRLIPKKALWSVAVMEDGPVARVIRPMPDGGFVGGGVEGRGATPELALCSACLKAQLASEALR